MERNKRMIIKYRERKRFQESVWKRERKRCLLKYLERKENMRDIGGERDYDF
jgi:hypothetical protein